MNFQFTQDALNKCQNIYNTLDPEERLFMSVYQLAKATGISSEYWKQFLSDKRVMDCIDEEINIFKRTQMNRLIRDVDNDKRSVGAGQMLNALSKTMDNDEVKEGDTFIYTYVPMNDREQNAPNTVQLNQDVFRR